MKVVAIETFGSDLNGEANSFVTGRVYEVSEAVAAEYTNLGWLKAVEATPETAEPKKGKKAQ